MRSTTRCDCGRALAQALGVPAIETEAAAVFDSGETVGLEGRCLWCGEDVGVDRPRPSARLLT